MRVGIAITSLVTLIALSGCGGSAGTTKERVNTDAPIKAIKPILESKPNQAKNINIAQPKIDRANWNGIAPVTDGLFVTDDETILSFKAEDATIAAGESRVADFLIDADNNAATGFSSQRWGNIGAEYLVEGRNLFTYTGDGTDWRWTLLSTIDTARADNWIESEFDMNLAQLSPTVRVVSALFNSDWEVVRRSNIVNYTITENNQGVGELAFNIRDNGTTLSLRAEDATITSGESRVADFLIDADNNAATGYTSQRWGAIGAEYLVEGRNIFTYAGDGRSWRWNLLSRIGTSRADNWIESEFDMNLAQLSPTIRVVSGLFNSDWANTRRSNIVSYNITDNNQGGGGTTFTMSDNDTNIQFILHSDRIQSGEATTEAILIDADNNPATGYNQDRWRNIGAEYMIEGRTLFRYGGAGWNWSVVDRIDRVIEGDRIELDFNKNLMTLSPTIRAVAGLVNAQWETVHMYDIVTYNVTNNNNGGGGDPDPEPARGVTITDDATTITLNVQSERIANGTATSNSIFIDTDNNPATGYNNDRWQAQLGAEYMIEGRTLFVHTAAGWNWNVVGRLERVVNNDTMTLTINKIDLNNLAQTVRVTSYLIDNQWRVIDRFNTISHINEEVQPPVDNGTLSVSHSLASFFITIDSELITTTNTTQIYIDSDNNPATGFNINGMGADYRVINNELSRYRMDNRTWVEASTDGVTKDIFGDHRAVTSLPRWRVDTRRNISVMATILDDENNIINTFNPIEYEVRGDDDEITMSLDDPNFYIFTIHNRTIIAGQLSNNTQSGDLIGVNNWGAAGGGIVTSLHLAFDMDFNTNTGNSMNSLGAEYWLPSPSNGRLYWGYDNVIAHETAEEREETGHTWISRWTISESGVISTVGNHIVEIRVPRNLFPTGRFNVAATLNGARDDRNGRGGHIGWTNRYEFDAH